MAKWDPERTFVTAQRIFGVVHSFSFFSSFSLTSASLATLSCGGALALLLFGLLLSRCCHSLAASVLVAVCQIAHARDKSFYQSWTLVVMWLVHQLAE